MRALQQTSLNGPQDLRLITDAPVPVPGPGEVLIRVTAAGVNFGDISQARGTFLGGPRPCGCRILCHLMRPGHIHGSGRQVVPAQNAPTGYVAGWLCAPSQP